MLNIIVMNKKQTSYCNNVIHDLDLFGIHM